MGDRSVAQSGLTRRRYRARRGTHILVGARLDAIVHRVDAYALTCRASQHKRAPVAHNLLYDRIAEAVHARDVQKSGLIHRVGGRVGTCERRVARRN